MKTNTLIMLALLGGAGYLGYKYYQEKKQVSHPPLDANMPEFNKQEIYNVLASENDPVKLQIIAVSLASAGYPIAAAQVANKALQIVKAQQASAQLQK